MPFLKSLPQDAVLLNVFKAFPGPSLPLLDYHEALMRGPSPLTEAERELIAAYVSGLNGCAYCIGVHQATAEVLGAPKGLVSALLKNFEASEVDAKMKPVLRYVRKLTVTPSEMSEADARGIFAAGWDERALHDAVSVCALFNFMNRFVDGLGIQAGPDYFRLASERLSKGGYAVLARMVRED